MQLSQGKGLVPCSELASALKVGIRADPNDYGEGARRSRLPLGVDEQAGAVLLHARL